MLRPFAWSCGRITERFLLSVEARKRKQFVDGPLIVCMGAILRSQYATITRNQKIGRQSKSSTLGIYWWNVFSLEDRLLLRSTPRAIGIQERGASRARRPDSTPNSA
jgi:hypothetical protein